MLEYHAQTYNELWRAKKNSPTTSMALSDCYLVERALGDGVGAFKHREDLVHEGLGH